MPNNDPDHQSATIGLRSADGKDLGTLNVGVATGLVSIPNRYMHSPNEMVDLADVDNAATLIAEFCRTVTAKTDLTAR